MLAHSTVTQPSLSQTTGHKPGLIKATLLLFSIMTALTGLVYPALITGISQSIFKDQANGSLIYRQVGDQQIVIGSKLVGQNFSKPQYFWPRPSATSPAYNAAASSGSNLGPTNQDFLSSVKARVEAVRANNSDFDKSKLVPVDLVTASGSGLDPDISPAAALLQVERIAKARGVSSEEVKNLVTMQTLPKQPGFLDEPRVNVLELNLALDTIKK